MVLINSSACSAEFTTAFGALENGVKIRRLCWPEGQYLQNIENGKTAVFRNGQLSSPSWNGPRGEETDASDWVTL